MHGLLVDVGEDHADALFGALVIQVLQRIEGRDVQRVDHVHADDQTAGELLDGDLADALGHAEKQGAADLVHPHMEGHLRQLILRHVLVLPAADLRLVAHALHEQQGGQQHAHLDGHHQIEDHRQQEGQHQHQQVAAGRAPAEPDEGAPLAHVVGDAEQDGGNAGHGNQRGVGHQHHQHQHKHQRVYHAGHRRAAAGLDVGGGAGDGAGGGDAAEQGGADVADALCDQLRVGVVVGGHHAVRHHAGQQALDSRQDRNGERAGDHALHGGKRKVRQREAGQPVGDGIEIADGVHRQLQKLHHGDAHQHGDKAAGNQAVDLRPEDQNGQTDGAHQHRPDIDGAQIPEKAGGLFHRLDGLVRVRHAEKVLPLADEDGHGDTGGKAGGDGVGDEADQTAQPQHAHQDQDNARHGGGQSQPAHAVLRHDASHDGGKGGGGTGDLHAASPEEGDQEAGDDGGVDALLRADAAGQSQSDGKGQRDDGHDHTGYQILCELAAGVVLETVKQRGGKHFLFHILFLSPFAAKRPVYHTAFARPAAIRKTAKIPAFLPMLCGYATKPSIGTPDGRAA